MFFQITKKNFNKRFKDLEIKNNDDKILLEKYLLFIGNSDFSESIFTLADMWNEFLIPLNDDEYKRKLKF